MCLTYHYHKVKKSNFSWTGIFCECDTTEKKDYVEKLCLVLFNSTLNTFEMFCSINNPSPNFECTYHKTLMFVVLYKTYDTVFAL